jgi:RNA polymerase sigma-B factor
VSPISSSEQRALLRAYHETGDREARDRLIADHLPLVRVLALRYAGRGEQLEDLVQVGSIGLIKAIERFDVTREVELAAYAVPTIVGEIKRHFRDRVWAVHVPRRMKELHARLSRLIDDLTATLGRSPTIAELALAAGVEAEEVVEALTAGQAYRAGSLSVGPEGDDGPDAGSIDSLPDVESAYEASEDRMVLAIGFAALDNRERQVLHLRFFDGLTQSEIAARIGVSQMHVSRLIRQALEKLYHELEEV